ncbi:MAG: 3'-5' exonuclease [Tannerellaceae bacterium]|jgi:DNA polymerase-3 subunit epsilon|nr:3'-5' exonuclease [Tannerellaceae bacterium]
MQRIISAEKILAERKDFAAIDFETANRNPSSVCSVGVVIVRGGQITEKIYRLIRPEPEWYSYWNTKIHGLSDSDTQNEPVFPHVWMEIAPKIDGLPLIAHNSPFDEGCLRAAHRVYQMDYPRYEFFCTCRASRRIFGNTLPNHQLQTVAAHCNYDLRQHHHALADAEACAAIALNVFIHSGDVSMEKREPRKDADSCRQEK